MASSSSSARVNNKAATAAPPFAAAAAASSSTAPPAASSSSAPVPSLGDLIGHQLRQLNREELHYKDELQLLLLLTPVQRQKLNRETDGDGQKDCNGGDTMAASTSAPLSRPEYGGEEDDDLIGAVGGLSISSPTPATTTTTTKEPLLDFRTHVLKWFQHLRHQTGHFKSEEESRRLREAGNDSYRKEKHPLKASDLFTEAIFLAPARNTLAAALAHANRSLALYDCGLYAESYDDCLCALDLGYPEEYLPLIKLRQAACALKLRNFALCEEHLHELLHIELNQVFETRTHELWHQCEVLKVERFEMAVQTGDDLETNDMKAFEIAWLDNSSSLHSTRALARNALIFESEAVAMVPSGNCRVCDYCGITQFIPFPCIYCSNRLVVYCSRQCRVKHAAIHSVECFGHQIELFESFGEVFGMPRLLQLALRMLITGLPELLAHCRKKPTLSKLWSAINGALLERQDIGYSSMLRLEKLKEEHTSDTLIALALAAHILAIYLNKCTTFFEQLEKSLPSASRMSNAEWELLCAALLMRHISQLRHRSLTHCRSFVLPADPHVFSPLNEFQLWAAPMRLQEGYLHLLAGEVAVVAYAVYPETLSLCRHSCSSTICSKFSGRKMTALALLDLPAGSGIYNCFASGNYQQLRQGERSKQLKEHGIKCHCNACQLSYTEDQFDKFHRYRCDNPKCMDIFTPHALPHAPNLRWWLSEEYTQPEYNGAELIVCPHCGEAQKLEWFWSFNTSLIDCELIEERCKLYAAIERAECHLMELHECKVALARLLLEQCLMVHREGATVLDDWEFNKLGSIMRAVLPGVMAQYGGQSIEYVKYFAYFWDVMALSKYKCNDRELMQMLNALEFIADEFKDIFINYYEDYIAPKFAEESYGSVVDTQV
ncbi:SET and MYND domain-containing protein 4 isoform X1 [Drosophila miranda]|uniref:SET and MYND domain-containing protein 4 isoform X1 n=1 Tax=Drosophila miranda TaxID=7229 RepID=UPI0007E6D704|nr:SET and MYND domain-containing protein 4 isoform X1 [Drosophila miranda]